MIPEVRDRDFGTRRTTWIKVACALIFTAALVLIPALMPDTNGAFTAQIKNPTNTVTVASPMTCREVMSSEADGVFAYQLDTINPVNLANKQTGTATATANVTISSNANACKYDRNGYASFTGTLASAPTVTYNVGVVPPETYTQEMWFKTTTKGGSLMALAERVRYFEPGDLLKANRQVFLDADGKLLMSNRFSTTSNEFVQSASSVADGRWHHVVATRNASQGYMYLYLDGDLLGSSRTGGTVGGAPTSYWRMGCADLTYFPGRSSLLRDCFEGDIAFAAVYNRAFTLDDVTRHYKAGTG